LSATPERMSKVDTAWLRMDTESNLMMIVGVWYIRPAISLAALKQRVQARLLQYTRFQQRVVEDALGAQWLDDEDFNIDRHVLAEVLLPPRGQDALKQRVAELAMAPLDPARPLWQFHLIEDLGGCDGEAGCSALIMRIHHCIGDGIALTAVMMSLTDGGSAPPKHQQQPRDDRDWLTDSLLRPIAELAVKAIAAAGSGVAKSVDASHHPLDASVDMARIGYQAVNDLAALAFMPDDSATRLKGKPGSEKRVAWSNDLPLDAVKAVGKGLGASINDVLLSCVAGAIGSYLRSKGEAVTAKQIRAMVPVNLRPPAHSYQLGNRFGLVPLLLPIGIENPVERLYAVRASMRALKGSFQPVLAFGLLAVAGLLIKPVQTAMLNLFAKKATAVMTNVPGPTEPLQLLGSQVERLMFWVPQSGDIGVGVSILTYAGRVQFGLITDSSLCPDPEGIIERFEPEFNQLLLLTLMLPWEG
jgi:diacylglycerol O-acyltransferase